MNIQPDMILYITRFTLTLNKNGVFESPLALSHCFRNGLFGSSHRYKEKQKPKLFRVQLAKIFELNISPPHHPAVEYTASRNNLFLVILNVQRLGPTVRYPLLVSINKTKKNSKIIIHLFVRQLIPGNLLR